MKVDIDPSGWAIGVHRIESPNQDERPDDCAVDLVVVHAISLPPDQFGGAGVMQLFCNALDPDEHPYYAEIAHLRVSAHFLVRRDGELLQFVPTTRRAWQAGQSCWRGRSRCNDFSVGIELEGCDSQGFEEAQYRVLSALLAGLVRRHPIVSVQGHSEIAPGRKTDPGPMFEWQRLETVLRECGLARA
ncbi:MAG: 1,6-anhydro-N-acetylmuramyl-L-alanine amidase AmpD [Gammaproteobacteria bacterium]|nr:1,6-anhydro-N-acetylmuramyl-L-alanine amidase AmpD [Gammaproteobacteria bacterium]